jgi:hypothetical protein
VGEVGPQAQGDPPAGEVLADAVGLPMETHAGGVSPPAVGRERAQS